MTRSRKYLYNLPNAGKIKQVAREILDCELNLDRVVSDKNEIKIEILSLETELISLDNSENPQKTEKSRERLSKLSNDILRTDNEIYDLKKQILNLQSIVDEEIREGLSHLFHQAKSGIDEAQQALVKHQTLANEAQNMLAKSSGNEAKKYRDEWILNVEKIIKDEEQIKKSEKQLEAIKRV